MSTNISIGRRLAAVAVLIMLHATAVLAAGDAAEAQKPNLFTGDLGNIIWSLVTFVAVLFVLGRFAWGPILGALQKREEFIRDSLAEARRDRQEAQAVLQKHTDKLNAARDEATAIVEEGRRDADVLRRKIEDDARTEAKAMVERARREIKLATDSAVKELYEVSSSLATEIASRIIREELDATKHERIIGEAIDELTQAVGSN